MTANTVRNGDVEIAYETFGTPGGEPLLLIGGLGVPMLIWREEFCERLVERGFHVARFDNRDSGLSTHFSAAGRPRRLAMLLQPASAAVYGAGDMAGDAEAVMDALGWSAAHAVGTSMGGLIAQVLAARRPDRVRTLTSISSYPDPRVGRPRPATLLKVLRAADPRKVKNRDGMAEYLVVLAQVTGSPAYPADEETLRDLGRRCYDRGGYDTAAVQRQTAAVAASGDRRAELARIDVPTLVLHGEEDRMVRPVAGRATANAIPGARLVTYPGMGHDLPAGLWPTITDEIAKLAETARC